MIIERPDAQPIIVMTRTFDAPRDMVWTAFTKPEHVSRWYGGHGFSSPVCEMDVRPGGVWRHTMRTPDGTDYAMEFVFVEVVRPERLVWKPRHHPAPAPAGQLNVVQTVTLVESGGQTRWTLVSTFDSVADRDLAMSRGFTRVIAQGSEKLEAIARSLAAPVAGASRGEVTP